MTKSEVIKLLAMLVAAYPHMKEVNEIQVNLWYECLKDVPLKEGLTNAKQHIMTSPYPPTIADIRGEPQNNRNSFHNFKQNKLTEEEVEAICERKRAEYLLKLQGDKKALPNVHDGN